MSFTPETLLRHWQTLSLIPRHPRKITAGELFQCLSGEGFSVAKRTVERDLQALSRVFPLVVDERSKPFGWSWAKDAPAFDLPGLSTSESLALLMAREYLSSVMPSSTREGLAPYFDVAEQKLAALVGRSAIAEWMTKVRLIPSSQPLIKAKIEEEVLSSLQEALLLGRQCQISYLSKNSIGLDEYPISPLGLVQRGDILYLVCTIKNYKDLRILAAHRVKNATLLDRPSEPPENFCLDAYLESGAFGWSKKEGEIFLEAIFEKDTGAHLYESPLSLDQQLSTEPDGKLRVTAKVNMTQQLVWWLLGFGPRVVVVAPLQLRQNIAEQLQYALACYQDE